MYDNDFEWCEFFMGGWLNICPECGEFCDDFTNGVCGECAYATPDPVCPDCGDSGYVVVRQYRDGDVLEAPCSTCSCSDLDTPYDSWKDSLVSMVVSHV